MLNLGTALVTTHAVMAAVFVVAAIVALSAKSTKAVIIIALCALAYFALAAWVGIPASDPVGVLNSAGNSVGNAATDAINTILP